MTNTRTPSATVKFYDMPDGTVETEVDMHGGYVGTEAQKIALRNQFVFPQHELSRAVQSQKDGLPSNWPYQVVSDLKHAND